MQNYLLDTADQHLESLVDKLLNDIPGSVVIVSTLLFNRNTTKEDLNQQLNQEYINMVQGMTDAGKLVHLTDMSDITAEDINVRDGTHPTNYNLAQMLKNSLFSKFPNPRSYLSSETVPGHHLCTFSREGQGESFNSAEKYVERFKNAATGNLDRVPLGNLLQRPL